MVLLVWLMMVVSLYLWYSFLVGLLLIKIIIVEIGLVFWMWEWLKVLIMWLVGRFSLLVIFFIVLVVFWWFIFSRWNFLFKDRMVFFLVMFSRLCFFLCWGVCIGIFKIFLIFWFGNFFGKRIFFGNNLLCWL